MKGVDTNSIMQRTSDVFYKGVKGENVSGHHQFNKESSLNMHSTHYKLGNNSDGINTEKQEQYK